MSTSTKTLPAGTQLRYAYLFPGQGSQSIGMLHDFAEHPLLQQTFAHASDVLQQDLWRLVCEGPKEELDLTVNTQPVMLTAGMAMYRIWMAETGIQPVCAAGHSLGEYTALCASGALEFDDAVRLVRLRAQAMLAAVPNGVGGMSAVIGLTADEVIKVCEQASTADEIVQAVNFNAPTQIVIAGHKPALARAALGVRELHQTCIELSVSGPFHSSLMQSAAEKFAVALSEVKISQPSFPVLHNFNARPCLEADGIADMLVKQLSHPVHWIEVIQYCLAQGVNCTIELGSGTTLSGLMRKNAPEVLSLPIHNNKSFLAAQEQIRALAIAD